MTHLGVKSVLDVGCGRGTSTAWFVAHELEYVRCVEGSHDAVAQSIVPDAATRVVEHDFSRGECVVSLTRKHPSFGGAFDNVRLQERNEPTSPPLLPSGRVFTLGRKPGRGNLRE